MASEPAETQHEHAAGFKPEFLVIFGLCLAIGVVNAALYLTGKIDEGSVAELSLTAAIPLGLTLVIGARIRAIQ